MRTPPDGPLTQDTQCNVLVAPEFKADAWLGQPASHLREIKDRLRNTRIGVIGQRPIDFLALARVVPLEVCLVCEACAEAQLVSGSAPSLSQEAISQTRRSWTNGSLGEMVCLADKHFGTRGGSMEPLNLLSYAASGAWESWVAQNGLHANLRTRGAVTKGLIDDKIRTRRQLAELGIRVPRAVVMPSSSLNFESLHAELGAPFVLQEPGGSSGIGTHLVWNQEGAERVRRTAKVSDVLASAYVGPCSLNIHGLVTDRGIEVSFPSVQIIGVPALTPLWGGYCGNDFGAVNNLPTWVLTEAEQLTRRVGDWLFQQGFGGLFGVDLVVGEHELHVLEVNPRMQGSTWLLSEIESMSGRVPLVLKHFLQSLGMPLNDDPPKAALVGAGNGPPCPEGAFSIIHHEGPDNTRLEHSVQPGVFTLIDGHIHRRRDGLEFELLEDDEFLVFGVVPSGFTIEPGAALVRFATKGRLVEGDSRSMTPFGQEATAAIKRRLLSPGESGSFPCPDL